MSANIWRENPSFYSWARRVCCHFHFPILERERERERENGGSAVWFHGQPPRSRPIDLREGNGGSGGVWLRSGQLWRQRLGRRWSLSSVPLRQRRPLSGKHIFALESVSCFLSSFCLCWFMWKQIVKVFLILLGFVLVAQVKRGF